MTVVSRINIGVEGFVLDDVVDAYVEWHEQSQGVWLAYRHWSEAPPEDLQLRFAAYVAALDQEQRACEVYAATIAQTVRAL
jgi:hypothetical protein